MKNSGSADGAQDAGLKQSKVASARAEEGGAFQTMDGRILGTPHFMPTEQAEGRLEAIDARADIYAMGGILYNILTLRPPVTGASLDEIIHKITSGNIPPPTAFNPKTGGRRSVVASAVGQAAPLVNSQGGRQRGPVALQNVALPHCPGGRIPDSLSAVTMKALAPRQVDRYQSVAELQNDIEAYQGGFATAAEKAGMLRQLALLLKRHKTEAVLIGSGLLVVIVLTTIFIFTILAGEHRAKANETRAVAGEKLAKTNEEHAQASEKEARDNLTRALTGEKMAKEEKEKAIAANKERIEALAKEAEVNKERAAAAEEREQALQQATAAQAEAKQSAEVAKAAEQTAKASEAKATAIERTAIQNLGIALATAPALYDQARALIEDQKFDEGPGKDRLCAQGRAQRGRVSLSQGKPVGIALANQGSQGSV